VVLAEKYQDKKNNKIVRSMINTLIKRIQELRKVGGRQRGRRRIM